MNEARRRPLFNPVCFRQKQTTLIRGSSFQALVCSQFSSFRIVAPPFGANLANDMRFCVGEKRAQAIELLLGQDSILHDSSRAKRR